MSKVIQGIQNNLPCPWTLYSAAITLLTITGTFNVTKTSTSTFSIVA